MAAAKAALDEAARPRRRTLRCVGVRPGRAKMDAAKQAVRGPLQVRRGQGGADEAARLAGNAAHGRRRREASALEEEARRRPRKSARRKAEEEARRLEEERLKKYPPIYTVQRGDSLWRITGMEKIYDNPIYWPIVYDANGDQIARSGPDLPRAGAADPARHVRGGDERRSCTRLWRQARSGWAEEE